jgi:hypothetical protein
MCPMCKEPLAYGHAPPMSIFFMLPLPFCFGLPNAYKKTVERLCLALNRLSLRFASGYDDNSKSRPACICMTSCIITMALFITDKWRFMRLSLPSL